MQISNNNTALRRECGRSSRVYNPKTCRRARIHAACVARLARNTGRLTRQVSRLLRDFRFANDDFVYQTIFDRFGGAEPEIAVSVFLDFLESLPGFLGENMI